MLLDQATRSREFTYVHIRVSSDNLETVLKKGFPFHWDHISEKDFSALKYVLDRAYFLYSPNYQRDYFIYLVVALITIEMVLVQEDDIGDKHPIYYLSWNLTRTKAKYSQVEKLALENVQVVQIFRHYILL